MKVAVITDNAFLKKKFTDLLKAKNITESFGFWSFSPALIYSFDDVQQIDLKKDWSAVQDSDLVLSLHCKQLFPPELVKEKRCINVHPGLNPYNRGWYPQVFSIINKMPAGATIHEIDLELDHGPVIAQKEVEVYSWDTSLSVYNRILDAELLLLEEYLPAIINNTYQSRKLSFEGNLNLKKDFNKLCAIDLRERATYAEVIDKLRALSHGDYLNGYFLDNKENKVFIRIDLIKEKLT